MKISIDIIERSFRDYVVKTHILDNAEVSLRKCAFFDPSETASEETIYLCRNSEQIDAEKLPYNCNLIFVEPLPDFDSEQLKHVNYLGGRRNSHLSAVQQFAGRILQIRNV